MTHYIRPYTFNDEHFKNKISDSNYVDSPPNYESSYDFVEMKKIKEYLPMMLRLPPLRCHECKQ